MALQQLTFMRLPKILKQGPRKKLKRKYFKGIIQAVRLRLSKAQFLKLHTFEESSI